MKMPSSRRDFLSRMLAALSGHSLVRARSQVWSSLPSAFTDDRVLSAILPAQGKPGIRYVGSATSHFQSEPILWDGEGRPVLASDWDVEVIRRVRGERSRIPAADVTNLPRFLARMEEYVGRSADLRENTYRFSLDFSRLCPSPGVFNESLMEQYLKTIIRIKLRGQEPFLTLHHFTMPRYLIETDRHGDISVGPWDHPKLAQSFRFYLQNVVRCLTDTKRLRTLLAAAGADSERAEAIMHEGLVQYFMTINEPAAIVFNGYVSGAGMPYKARNVFAVSRVLGRLAEAHDTARDLLRSGLRLQSRAPWVCLGHNWQFFDGFIGTIAKDIQMQWTDRFERDGNRSDFLGLHYYFRRTIPLSGSASKRRDYSDQPQFGDIYPKGILEVLTTMHARYPKKTIWVSEIGFSDHDDRRRPLWLLETLRYIIEAKAQSIPIEGVLVWTLVNNFEWDLGMSQKFGFFSETELGAPPRRRPDALSSWEVWQACIAALTAPSPATLSHLQSFYERALVQYHRAGGKY
jgi:beta-glucosidase